MREIDWEAWDGEPCAPAEVANLVETAIAEARRPGNHGLGIVATGDSLVIAELYQGEIQLRWCMVRRLARVPLEPSR